jgi:hypothetical protein
MNLNNMKQADKSFFSVLKKYYITIIFFPIILIFSAKFAIGLQLNSNFLLLKSFTYFITLSGIIFPVLWIAYLFCYFIHKRKIKTAIYVFSSFIMIMILLIAPIIKCEIDTDWVNMFFYKKEYLHIIDKQPSIVTDGKAKLVKIKKESNWLGCDSYILYDEDDELLKSNNNFIDINYKYDTYLQGDKHNKKITHALIKSYGDHLYIIHLCENTGQ